MNKDITYCKFFVTVKELIKEDEGEGAEGAVEKVQWRYYYLTLSNNDDTFIAHHDLDNAKRQIWFFDAAHEGPTPLKNASTG